MPTYDGMKIITGILYEDGNIVIRDGFVKQLDKMNGVKSCSVISLNQKCKMITPPGINENSTAVKTLSISLLKQRKTIISQTLNDGIVGVKVPTITEFKQKTVIVNP